MAEYINRDELFKHYRALANIEWNKTVAPISWCDAYEEIADHIAELPPADVVPKSEVDKLKIAYEGSQKTIKGLTETIREKNKELAKLETHLELHHGERSLNNLIAKEKYEVAREIFEEIGDFLLRTIGIIDERMDKDLREGNFGGANIMANNKTLTLTLRTCLAELKKKYTESCTKCTHFVGCEPSTLGICEEYEEKKE